MKQTFSRRSRRRTASAKENNPFKREAVQEHTFFGGPSHDAFFQPSVAVQRKCEKCEKEEKQVHRMEEKKEKEVQREPEKKEEEKIERAADKKDEEKVQKKDAGSTSMTGGNISSYVGSLNGKGQSLPATINEFFSSRMEADFSHVKIHTDKEAAASAREVNAKAYTIGNNIVFNEGRYNTQSTEGKKLLAHELVHVVQNEKGGVGILNRKAEFKEGKRVNNRNLAEQYVKLQQGDTDTEGGSTHALINDVDIYSGNLKGNPVNVPAADDLKTSNVNGEFESSVATLPTNTTSDFMQLPQKDRWKIYADVSKLPGVFKNKTCNVLQTLVLVDGDPDNATVTANVETHENVHVVEIQESHKEAIEQFDNSLKSAKVKDKDEKAAKTKLLEKITQDAWNYFQGFIRTFQARASGFHGRPEGKKLSFSPPKVDPDCTTVKANVR